MESEDTEALGSQYLSLSTVNIVSTQYCVYAIMSLSYNVSTPSTSGIFVVRNPACTQQTDKWTDWETWRPSSAQL